MIAGRPTVSVAMPHCGLFKCFDGVTGAVSALQSALAAAAGGWALNPAADNLFPPLVKSSSLL